MMRFSALATVLGLAAAQEVDRQHEYRYIDRTPACVAGLADSTRGQVLHQMTWRGGAASLPPYAARLRESWTKHNPDWTHRLWDEDAVSALVNESYPWFADTYSALPSNLQREEVAPYLVLHALGGVFADTDVECFKKFELPEGKVLQFFEEPMDKWETKDIRGLTQVHNVISSSLLAATAPGHPLLLRLLQTVKPLGEAYAPTNNQLVQAELQSCQTTPNEETCGCYRTMSSELYYPAHSALLPPLNYSTSVEQVGAHEEDP